MPKKEKKMGVDSHKNQYKNNKVFKESKVRFKKHTKWEIDRTSESFADFKFFECR